MHHYHSLETEGIPLLPLKRTPTHVSNITGLIALCYASCRSGSRLASAARLANPDVILSGLNTRHLSLGV